MVEYLGNLESFYYPLFKNIIPGKSNLEEWWIKRYNVTNTLIYIMV
jgi:hypothetical protein